MESYVAFFAILILLLGAAIMLDRRWKNMFVGVAGGFATAAILWFIATMLFYRLVPG
jgi:hypothetical protein